MTTYSIDCYVTNNLGEDVYFGYCAADNYESLMADVDLKKVANNERLHVFSAKLGHRITFSFCVVDSQSYLWAVSNMMTDLKKSDGTIVVNLQPGILPPGTIGYTVPMPSGTLPAVSVINQKGNVALAENTSFIARTKSYAP